MNFTAPLMLIGLALVPVGILYYLWAQRRRSRYAVRFTNVDLLANLAPRRPGWRRHVPPALYLLAIAGLVFALARPSVVMASPREDATVVLAMDVSGSMDATDVDPTRLDAAIGAAKSFLAELPAGIRVALISFSDEPVTLVAPTADRALVTDALDRLTAGGGTAMGDAIERMVQLAKRVRDGNEADAGRTPTASSAPGASQSPTQTPAPTAGASGDPGASQDPSTTGGTGGALVAGILLSDGSNSVGDVEPLDAAQDAAKEQLPIYTIALGTAEGTIQGRNEFGFNVTIPVPPDRETLDAVAKTTGGASFDAPTSEQLQAVYANLQSRIGTIQREQEVTAYFAGAGLVLVVLGAGLAAMWFGRLP
jgi:Ca-activated chloride channel homolog